MGAASRAGSGGADAAARRAGGAVAKATAGRVGIFRAATATAAFATDLLAFIGAATFLLDDDAAAADLDGFLAATAGGLFFDACLATIYPSLHACESVHIPAHAGR